MTPTPAIKYDGNQVRKQKAKRGRSGVKISVRAALSVVLFVIIVIYTIIVIIVTIISVGSPLWATDVLRETSGCTYVLQLPMPCAG